MSKFKSFDLSSKIIESEKELGIKLSSNDNIIRIDPSDISNWEYRDRSNFELGNIEELSESIRNNGQAQPIVIVKKNNIFKPDLYDSDSQYIVIAGYRRWKACKLLNIEIECILKDYTFEQAIGILISENEKEDVSDYSKGILYSKLLLSDKISQQELSRRLNISKNKMSNYLAFSSFPDELVESIGSFKNVSSRTAGYIRSLINKDDSILAILIKHASKISSGIGERKIDAIVYREKKSETKDINKYTFGNSYISLTNNKNIRFSTDIYEHKNFKKFRKELIDIFKENFDG